MGHSQAGKARNRERILKAAAAQVREEGLHAVSVGGLMEKVDLTHGGFYVHFKSRSDLLAEALKRALEEGERGANASAVQSERARGFAGFVRSYLSRTHRDAPEKGCAISALLSDVGRADAKSRSVMAEHIERYIGSIAEGLGEKNDAQAIVAVSAMIGALGVSRVLTDPKRSDQVLKAVRDYVIAMKKDRA